MRDIYTRLREFLDKLPADASQSAISGSMRSKSHTPGSDSGSTPSRSLRT